MFNNLRSILDFKPLSVLGLFSLIIIIIEIIFGIMHHCGSDSSLIHPPSPQKKTNNKKLMDL